MRGWSRRQAIRWAGFVDSVRTPAERYPEDEIWLRTCYFDRDGNSTDAAHKALFAASDLPQEEELLFDDVTRYNYGSDWQRIFSRIPQFVCAHIGVEEFENIKAEALAEGRMNEEYDKAEVEEGGYNLSEDGAHWSDLYSWYHAVNSLGVIWVADQEALETGNVLMAWFDECGRTVRQARTPGSHTLGGNPKRIRPGTGESRERTSTLAGR